MEKQRPDGAVELLGIKAATLLSTTDKVGPEDARTRRIVIDSGEV